MLADDMEYGSRIGESDRLIEARADRKHYSRTGGPPPATRSLLHLGRLDAHLLEDTLSRSLFRDQFRQQFRQRHLTPVSDLFQRKRDDCLGFVLPEVVAALFLAV